MYCHLATSTVHNSNRIECNQLANIEWRKYLDKQKNNPTVITGYRQRVRVTEWISGCAIGDDDVSSYECF